MIEQASHRRIGGGARISHDPRAIHDLADLQAFGLASTPRVEREQPSGGDQIILTSASIYGDNSNRPVFPERQARLRANIIQIMNQKGIKTQKALAKQAKIDYVNFNKFMLGKSGTTHAEKIANGVERPVRELTGEEPGESEARAMQRISDNIQHYLGEKSRAKLAFDAGIDPGEVTHIINKERLPLKPTLEAITKALLDDNATIDDFLKPLPPAF